MKNNQKLVNEIGWYNKLRRHMNALQNSEVLSIGEFNLLYAISNDPSFKPSGYARQIGVSKSMISSLLGRMIQAGAVREYRAVGDRRYKVFEMTGMGNELVRQYTPKFQGKLESIQMEMQLWASDQEYQEV